MPNRFLTCAIGLVLFVALFAFKPEPCVSEASPPIDIQMVSPTNGSTVSGTIQVAATAHGLTSPVVKVEFYRDGVLIGTVIPPSPPSRLTVATNK